MSDKRGVPAMYGDEAEFRAITEYRATPEGRASDAWLVERQASSDERCAVKWEAGNECGEPRSHIVHREDYGHTFRPAQYYRTSTQTDALRATAYPEIGYIRSGRGDWRFVAMETGSTVGRSYGTKAELLANLHGYAAQYGCEGTNAADYEEDDNGRFRRVCRRCGWVEQHEERETYCRPDTEHVYATTKESR